MSESVNITEEVVTVNVDTGDVEVVSVGIQGPAGSGIPTGGTTGQVLTKASNDDLDAEWAAAPGAAVTSVHGRTGAVTAASGDYTATQVTNTPAGNIAATTVQAALNELDSEKAATSHTHAISDTTGLQTAIDAKVSTASNVGTPPEPLNSASVFKQKTGTDLEFHKISGDDSTGILVSQDGDSDTVIIGIEASQLAPNISHNDIQDVGTNTHDQIDSHIANTSNPHSVTKSQVGLGNVDNTSDASKPISTATQTALDGKSSTSHTHLLAAGATDVTASAAELNTLDGITASTTELNYTDGVTSAIQAQLDGKAASSHAHAISDTTGLQTALDAKVDENAAITGATKTKITYDAKGLVTAGADATQDDIGDGTTYRQYSATEKTKLAGIETAADVTDTANVTAAGALMDSEVTSLSGIKTLTVPDSTTISTFGASLVDDASASNARTTLGLGTIATVAAPSGTVVGTSDTQTITNKRVTPRVGTTTSSATPTINTDNVDHYSLTAQTADITSFTTNLSGTPTDGQKLWISITGTAARAITWGSSFESSTVTLPTTTVTTNRLDVGFVWNAATSKWRCVAVA